MNYISKMRKLAITIDKQNWIENPADLLMDILEKETPSFMNEEEDRKEIKESVGDLMVKVEQKDYSKLDKLIKLFELTYKIMYGHLFDKNIKGFEDRLRAFRIGDRDWRYLKYALDAFISYSEENKNLTQMVTQSKSLITILRNMARNLRNMEGALKGNDERKIEELKEDYTELKGLLENSLKRDVRIEQAHD